MAQDPSRTLVADLIRFRIEEFGACDDRLLQSVGHLFGAETVGTVGSTCSGPSLRSGGAGGQTAWVSRCRRVNEARRQASGGVEYWTAAVQFVETGRVADVKRPDGSQPVLKAVVTDYIGAAAPQRTTAADGLQIDLLREDGSVLTGFRHNPGPWSGAKDAQKLKGVRFTYAGDGSGGIRVRITSATPGSSKFGGAIDDLKVSAGARTFFYEDFDDLRRGSIKGAQLRLMAKHRETPATKPRRKRLPENDLSA